MAKHEELAILGVQLLISHSRMFSIGEALRFGWGVFKQHVLFFIGLLLLVWGSVLLLQFLVGIAFPETKGPEFTVMGVVWGIVLQVLSILLQMGLLYITLEFMDGKTPRYADIIVPWKRFLPYLGGSILYGLIVVGGLILLVVPGIYWAIKYQFVPYLIIDRDLGPIQALRKSGEITKGMKWDLLGFWATLIIVCILGFLALFVGVFAAVPIALMATVYVYRALLRAHETSEATPETAPGGEASASAEPAPSL